MRALALLSGGLDSTLAIRVILDQGIEVEAINFFTPFCLCNRNSGCGNRAKKVADRFGVRLKIFNIAAEYLEIIKKPKHGYGKNLNPCIDCRILMHKKAKEYMKAIGASFVITGEVLGQRPMSQHKKAFKIIERESGLEGLVLRPLSARLLPLTIPEKEGWVKRERLSVISGRSRKPQMVLARDFEISDYPCSAGGCLLTDPGFSRRVEDLMTYSEITLNDIELLKVGRHFRLSSACKVVIGRNKEENGRLLGLARMGDIIFKPVDGTKGPISIGRGNFKEEDFQNSASIIARYCTRPTSDQVKIACRKLPNGIVYIIFTRGMWNDKIQKLRI